MRVRVTNVVIYIQKTTTYTQIVLLKACSVLDSPDAKKTSQSWLPIGIPPVTHVQ